jgi:hypothetical protein
MDSFAAVLTTTSRSSMYRLFVLVEKNDLHVCPL